MRMRCSAVLGVLVLALSASGVWAEDAGSEAGFEALFNGKDLSGWEGAADIWSVQEGAIVGQTKAEAPIKTNTFLIWRGGTVENFVLRAQYRLTNGNTGIQYRSHEIKDVPYGLGGYQADIASDGWISGINYEERGRGILAKQGEKVKIGADGAITVVEKFAQDTQIQAVLKPQDWNEYEVVVEGNRLIHKINGQVTSEVVDEQPEKSAASGLIGLQVHAGPPMRIEFKDLRLKRLPAAKAAKHGDK